MRSWVRYLFMGLGFLFVGLAGLGVFLPLIPTTPFLLLAVFFFARSSQRWQNWLLNHRIFGQYLRDYQNHEMTTGSKAGTITFMWVGMGVCMFVLRERPWLVGLLLVIAVGVTIHLLLLSAPERSAAASESADAAPVPVPETVS
ncbi:MAG: YbaN family protein [Varibaculum sp.]|nr:YbaN family protein [Varibaculum sp.]